MHTVAFFMGLEKHIRTKWGCPYEALPAPRHPLVGEEGVKVPMRWVPGWEDREKGWLLAGKPDKQAHSRLCK